MCYQPLTCLCPIHGLLFWMSWMHEDMLFQRRGVCDTYENSGISGEYRRFWCIIRIRSIWPTLYLWGHSTSLVHPMGPACVGYIPGPSRKSDATLSRSRCPIWSLESRIRSCWPNYNFCAYVVEYGGLIYIKLFLADWPTRIFQN